MRKKQNMPKGRKQTENMDRHWFFQKRRLSRVMCPDSVTEDHPILAAQASAAYHCLVPGIITLSRAPERTRKMFLVRNIRSNKQKKLTWGMNLSLVEKVCYFFNSLGIIDDVQGSCADIEPSFTMTVCWISLIQHLKNWVFWVCSYGSKKEERKKMEHSKNNHFILSKPMKNSAGGERHSLNYFPASPQWCSP